MIKKLYVANLSFNVSEEQVKEFFETIGSVSSVKIITDRDSGKSRGFCFVEMENGDEAIVQLNGKELDGRNISVSEARERASRSGGDRGGRGGLN